MRVRLNVAIKPENLLAAIAEQSKTFSAIAWRLYRQEERVNRLEIALEAAEVSAIAAKQKTQNARQGVTLLKKMAAADPHVVRLAKRLAKAKAKTAYLKNMLTVMSDRGKQLTNLTILASRESSRDAI